MKKLLCIILAIVAAVSFAACAGSVSAEFKPALDTARNCSITVAGSYDNFEALEAAFDRFNAHYPNVRLSYVKLDDYNNSIGTALGGNDKPNIFFSYTWMIGNEKYDSVVSHMEVLSDPALKLNFDCIRPGLINRDAEGRVTMVPVFSRTYGMLVNDDLFKKEGLSVPTTKAEFDAVCKAFKDKGYKNPVMGYSLKSSSCLMNTVAYPLFLASLAGNADALAKANSLDPAAGEYMRSALEAVDQLMKSGFVDLAECDKIEDNYTKVILRFFEGDVPMMVCTGDTVSGTKKRESQSEAFTNSPFAYSFHPVPMSDKGGYFIDSPSV
ncbi:MAG: carbohydrate ABC transporter substrate-binding protein, partial [Clostridia bacterium]|nr:carbohydrate ABC transporter substrate-binding protein [Clostridia bacterium]